MREPLTAQIAYVRDTGERPRYYANAHEKDTIVLDPQAMPLVDLRGQPTSLDVEGCVLVEHRSQVLDFTDPEVVGALHGAEISELLRRLTGCSDVVVTPRAILRYSEKSGKTGSSDNSHPARFAHVDMSRETGVQFRARSAPVGKTIQRSAQYNVWRAISGAPQDVPLALCDARSVKGPELIKADAIFDPPGGAPEFSFEGYVVAHDPAHRWLWFSDMSPKEVIVFKTSESDPELAQCIPHVAFDDPHVADDAPPRVSVEMRATCYWCA
jgi:hypothetical protein